jgi:hypothetical protein
MNPVARRLSVYSADPGRRSSIHSIPDRSRRQKSPALIDVLRAWGDSARTLRDWVHRFNAAGPDGTGSSTGRMFDGTPIAGPTGRVGENRRDVRFRRSRPCIPTGSRPGFRFDVGHPQRFKKSLAQPYLRTRLSADTSACVWADGSRNGRCE